jgi:hypothetical protein
LSQLRATNVTAFPTADALSLHEPAEQTCPELHAWPQDPQLAVFVSVFTQDPLQDVSPEEQPGIFPEFTHWPLWQTWADVQKWVQVPQWLMSVCVFTQHPLQEVRPPVQVELPPVETHWLFWQTCPVLHTLEHPPQLS